MRDSIKDESFENEHILYELQAAILWPCIAQHGLQARADIQLQVPPPPPPPPKPCVNLSIMEPATSKPYTGKGTCIITACIVNSLLTMKHIF